jgi:hypothetical protein
MKILYVLCQCLLSSLWNKKTLLTWLSLVRPPLPANKAMTATSLSSLDKT